MKKSLLKSALVLAVASAGVFSTSYAALTNTDSLSSDNTAGFIVGIQGGYAETHWSDAPLFSILNSSISDDSIFNIKDKGFTTRGFIGYDFNQYFGLETGYTYLPSTKVNFFDQSYKIKNYGIDVLGKLSVPVTNVFKVYAKAGGVYLHSKTDIADLDNTSTSHIGPAFGVGAAYEIIPNLSIDASWMRFSGNTDINNYQPSPDVFLLGASYKFPVNIS